MNRGTAAQRGYGARWAAYSRQYRKENPLCVDCLARGVLTSVEHGGHVDHIQAVSGPSDPLFWEPANHQSLCHSCHSRKTAFEDGSFGNKKGKGKVRADCGIDGVPVDGGHHWRK
ncbi:HNH endonuclease [Geomonas nitrogeniifigens]|uniref:HNH endonuclease n=1 Tax=Geomonas diazotrophica TaxID=2843197 RepID=UPI001C2C85DB|nr:HNH endonuclease [Geomonas nitrogeniifigens]